MLNIVSSSIALASVVAIEPVVSQAWSSPSPCHNLARRTSRRAPLLSLLSSLHAAARSPQPTTGALPNLQLGVAGTLQHGRRTSAAPLVAPKCVGKTGRKQRVPRVALLSGPASFWRVSKSQPVHPGRRNTLSACQRICVPEYCSCAPAHCTRTAPRIGRIPFLIARSVVAVGCAQSCAAIQYPADQYVAQKHGHDAVCRRKARPGRMNNNGCGQCRPYSTYHCLSRGTLAAIGLCPVFGTRLPTPL